MKSINQIHREFLYARVTGTTSQSTIAEMLPVFYSTYTGAQSTPTTGLIDLENQFLRKIITDNSQTPSSIYNADLWRQAVTALGLVPSKHIQENKRLIYLNLPL